MQKRFAAIGSRDLNKVPHEGRSLYEAICKYYGSAGWTCRTGAAKGSDQLAAETVWNSGGIVELCLPWFNYEKEWWSQYQRTYSSHRVKVDWSDPLEDPRAVKAIQLHDKPEVLTLSDRKLMARNYRIMDSDGEKVRFAIALPRPPAEGGTKHGMKVAISLGISCFNLSIESGRKAFFDSEFCTPEILRVVQEQRSLFDVF